MAWCWGTRRTLVLPYCPFPCIRDPPFDHNRTVQTHYWPLQRRLLEACSEKELELSASPLKSWDCTFINLHPDIRYRKTACDWRNSTLHYQDMTPPPLPCSLYSFSIFLSLNDVVPLAVVTRNWVRRCRTIMKMVVMAHLTTLFQLQRLIVSYELGRRRSWPIWSYYPGIHRKEIWEGSERIADGFRVENRTGYPPNAKGSLSL